MSKTQVRLIALDKQTNTEALIHRLAYIENVATLPDPYNKWMALFTEHDEYSETVEALKHALSEKGRKEGYEILMAVRDDGSKGTDVEFVDPDEVVGFAHWQCGYIELEKVDPFAPKREIVSEPTDAKDVAGSTAEELGEKAQQARTQDDEDKARRMAYGEKVYVETRNIYIAAIRGKKHMFIRRVMILPECQGQGIGKKLLKTITDAADAHHIVCWLFARPAGAELYKKVGFELIAETSMDAPELKCPPAMSMMRPWQKETS